MDFIKKVLKNMAMILGTIITIALLFIFVCSHVVAGGIILSLATNYTVGNVYYLSFLVILIGWSIIFAIEND